MPNNIYIPIRLPLQPNVLIGDVAPELLTVDNLIRDCVDQEGLDDVFSYNPFAKKKGTKMLDIKTIKNLKVEYVSVNPLKKDLFIALKSMKSLLSIATDNSTKKDLITRIQSIRKIIKNKTTRLRYTHKNTGVSTYTTPSNQTDVISRVDNRSYVLKRIKEKLQEHRRSARNKNPVYKQFYGSDYYLIGGVHGEKNCILRIYQTYRRDMIQCEKTPGLDADYVGVELEFIVRESFRGLENQFINDNLHKYVNLKSDSSIDYDEFREEDEYGDDESGYNGIEVNILAKESEIHDIVKRVCRILRSNGAIVNDSCGVHVHIDCRNRNHEKAYKKLFNIQDLMFKAVNNNRKSNSYCNKNRSNDFNTTSGERYLAINGMCAYQKFKTIEIRLHQGSVDAVEINNWIKLLLKTVNHRQEIRNFESFKDLSAINMDKDVIDYYTKLEARA